MTLIESVRAYLKQCHLLTGDRLNVDFLPPEHGSYSIDVSPVKPVLDKYIDGTSKRQFVFSLSSSEYYGPDVRQNIDNLGFYEQFAEWIETAPLPVLATGKTAQKIEAISSGYVFMAEADAARYQIQCRLIYFQGRA